MKPAPWTDAEPYRRHNPHYPRTEYGDPCGYFEVPYQGRTLKVVAAADGAACTPGQQGGDHG